MEDEKKHEGAMIVRFFLTKTCYVLKNTLAMDTAKNVIQNTLKLLKHTFYKFNNFLLPGSDHQALLGYHGGTLHLLHRRGL